MFRRPTLPKRPQLSTSAFRECGLAVLVLSLSACGSSVKTAVAKIETAPSEPFTGTAKSSAEKEPPPEEAMLASNQIDENGELLISDLEDGNAEFELLGAAGEWFTYADGTAEVSPPDHGGVGDTPGQVHVTGEGFSDWGVGLAAFVQNEFQFVDLSGFTGLKVRLKGTGTVRLEVSTPATLPLDHFGVCETGCYRHFSKLIPLPAEYEDVTILFSELRQPGGPPVEFSLEQVGQVDFLAAGNAGSPASIDLWVDRLSLIGAKQ